MIATARLHGLHPVYLRILCAGPQRARASPAGRGAAPPHARAAPRDGVRGRAMHGSRASVPARRRTDGVGTAPRPRTCGRVWAAGTKRMVAAERWRPARCIRGPSGPPIPSRPLAPSSRAVLIRWRRCPSADFRPSVFFSSEVKTRYGFWYPLLSGWHECTRILPNQALSSRSWSLSWPNKKISTYSRHT